MDNTEFLIDNKLFIAALIIVAIIVCFIIFKRIISAIKPRLSIEELIHKIENLEENKGEGIILILNKYYWQRVGITPISPTSEDISEEKKKRFAEYDAWRDDGKTTGIESDEMFFSLQRHVFGDVIWTLKEFENKKPQQK